MQSSSSGVPAVLGRYPAEIQSAYMRFIADGNDADLKLLVHAALREYMPRNPARIALTLGAGQRLIDDLGIDSLAVAEMIFFFEDLFNVSIPSNEILGLKTVGELEGFVRAKLQAGKSSAAVAP